MRRVIISLLVLCLVVCGVAIAADYYAGTKNTVSGTSDFKVDFSGSATDQSYNPSKVTVKAADAFIGVAFWHYTGAAWEKLLPESALGDTVYPLDAGDILNQEFPIRGKYPHVVVIERTSATPVNVYWR